MSFRFCLTQTGCEKALKAEVLGMGLPWKFAFSRPGLVTFRLDQGRAEPLGVKPSLARVCGESIGSLEKMNEADLKRLKEKPIVGVLFWDRARDEEQGPWPGDPDSASSQQLAALLPGKVFSQKLEGPGVVLHWIVTDPGKVTLGLQELSRGESGVPGGAFHQVLPDRAPSRAWLKLEELSFFMRPPMQARDRVLEVGCAPGGMSKALLDRGCEVWGVDTGQMDDSVLKESRFHWLRMGVQSLRKEDLSHGYEWLVVDMNVRPEIAVDQILRILPFSERDLLGALLTLKVNDERAAEHLPRLIRVLREDTGLGRFPRFEARQLYANRNEIAVYFETRKAQLRRQSQILAAAQLK